MYPIQEISTLEQTLGIWYYVKGEVERPGAENSQKMMNDWPQSVGLELKFDEESMNKKLMDKKQAPLPKKSMMDYEGNKKFKSKQSQNNVSKVKNSERSGSP